MEELLRVDREAWKGELGSIREHFDQFGSRLPKELWDEFGALEKRLSS
jgi:phosphoenolpyruvate carboxykinase (GTP)